MLIQKNSTVTHEYTLKIMTYSCDECFELSYTCGSFCLGDIPCIQLWLCDYDLEDAKEY